MGRGEAIREELREALIEGFRQGTLSPDTTLQALLELGVTMEGALKLMRRRRDETRTSSNKRK